MNFLSGDAIRKAAADAQERAAAISAAAFDSARTATETANATAARLQASATAVAIGRQITRKF